MGRKRSVLTVCSSALWVLGFLNIFSGSESAVHQVKVELHDPALLPCSERCSGVVKWTVFHKPSYVLAECDRTSCRSVKEGYQMIHEDYLKGNLSLSISGADFRKRALYVCDCDGTDLCDVTLQIEPLETLVQMKPNGTLVLKLDVSEPVEVIYNSSGAAGPSSGQICKVDGGSLQCRPEYTGRTSLSSSLELRGMKESDSGVYTVQDPSTEEVLHIYTVTVKDGGDGSEALGLEPKLSQRRRSAESSCPPCKCKDPDAGVLVWVVVLLVVLLAVIVGAAIVILRLKREIQKLQTGSEMNVRQEQNGVEAHGDVPDDPEGQRLAETPA